jgi:uncharacterized BrkB/YihY/UPF0761 family membrane protein
MKALKVINICILLVILLVVIITLMTIAKFRSDHITFHIHDTYIIVGYMQLIYFLATIAGLTFLFKTLFKSSKRPPNY